MSDILEHLQSWCEAYPEDVFTPLSDEDRRCYPKVISRASGQAGRHFVEVYGKPAIAEITHLNTQLSQLRKALHVAEGLIPADGDGPLYDDWYELRRLILDDPPTTTSGREVAR